MKIFWILFIKRLQGKCGGPDSNRRTPAGTDPKSVTFDLARQPPLNGLINMIINYFLYKSMSKKVPIFGKERMIGHGIKPVP